MKKFRVVIFLTISSLFHVVEAQQFGSNTQFMFNQLALNPAYAGIHESLKIDLNLREQWFGMDGAPSTQQVGIHGAHKYKPISYGGMLLRDNVGLTSRYKLDFVSAYRIRTSYDSKLSFGLQAGLLSSQIDFSQADMTDPTLAGASESQIAPTIGAGILWHSPTYYLGLGVPQLLRLDLGGEDSAIIENTRHYYITGGFIHEINRDLLLKPNSLLKLAETGQYQLDLNISLLIDKVFWLGVTYSHENSISGLISSYVNDDFQVGYSYDHPFENALPGSHELFIGYRFKRTQNRYSKPIFF